MTFVARSRPHFRYTAADLLKMYLNVWELGGFFPFSDNPKKKFTYVEKWANVSEPKKKLKK